LQLEGAERIDLQVLHCERHASPDLAQTSADLPRESTLPLIEVPASGELLVDTRHDLPNVRQLCGER
jgi:hypothetical protein